MDSLGFGSRIRIHRIQIQILRFEFDRIRFRYRIQDSVYSENGFDSTGFGFVFTDLDSIRLDSDSFFAIWIRFGWIRIRPSLFGFDLVGFEFALHYLDPIRLDSDSFFTIGSDSIGFGFVLHYWIRFDGIRIRIRIRH